MATERQYPWSVLAIDETNDKKCIKKAYAVLIKQYKPDEYPEKFQEIQNAYQHALKTPDKPEVIVNHYPQNKKRVVFDETEARLLNEILDKIENLLDKGLTEINKIENWSFIQKDEAIYNIEYKYELSASVFKRLAEYNLSKSKTIPLIDVDILSLLKKHYQWDEYWQNFAQEFPSKYFNINLLTLELRDTLKNREPVTYKRFISVSLDFILPALLMAVIEKMGLLVFNIKISEQISVYSMLLLFLIIRILMEIYHPLHRSLGKFPLNLFILTTRGKFCSVPIIVTRNILVTLMLLPLITATMVSADKAIVLYTVFAGILVINYMADVFEGGFVHDLITKTRVFKL